MVVLRGGAYCGLAPVPGGRVNVGIVLAGRGWRDRLAATGAAATGKHVLASIPRIPGDPEPWRDGATTDAIAGASPLGSRVARRSGPDWLLVGDAAGFLDPFTGEGLHRALVSARLAAETIDAHLRGDAGELAPYDRAMAGRFATKDRLSLLVQAFLGRPALFEHAARRLAHKPDIRATMGLVMGDLVPASRAFDPRFLAGLLVP
jgi:flavin-dependent dehydrogenase